MVSPRDFQKRRFREVLNGYCEKHRLSAAALASFLVKPESTVYHWLDGTHLPPKKIIRKICAQLNISHDGVFAPDLAVQDVLDQKYMSPEAIDARFLELAGQEHRFDLVKPMAFAGAVVLSFLVQNGYPCELRVNEAAEVAIIMRGQLLGLVLHINGDKEIGLRIRLCDNAGSPQSAVGHQLTELSLQNLREQFKKIIDADEQHVTAKRRTPARV